MNDNEPKTEQTINESSLLFQSGTFQIHRSPKGYLEWSWKDLPDDLTSVLVLECTKIEALISTEVPKFHEKVCYEVLFRSITACLNIPQRPEFSDYKTRIVNELSYAKDFVRKKINLGTVFVSSSSNITIYMERNKELRWYYEGLPEYMVISFSEFRRLHSLSNSLLNGVNRELINRNLAVAMTNSNILQDPDRSSAQFSEIENSIKERATARVKFNILLLISTLGLVIIFLCFYFYFSYVIPEIISNLIIGAAGGTLGSVISVIQRNDKITVDFLLSPLAIGTESISRLLLGIIFGIILVLLIQSELITLFSIKNISALCVLSIIAGFSERFVPDFLDKIINKDNTT
ncbi:hypothetical protein QE450_000831 [Paenibacillus sp. SORGH_AS306]|uniref:hypothetical protein n=1 Tax=unclassified Paenibacillus TaxID=185978 RepID=UPI002784B1C1|nr:MULTISPECIES: hypothetical protein [unclassified Paenibacillus]MDQ1233333.1 hypothetical protein [Paenibacillus sp. SORGH_AS_0306]MDR6110374.1 hypothetical protein [Paenibacillus sp. SORGH_AS_0338]